MAPRGELPPTGITGDVQKIHESSSEASRQALLAQQVRMNDLLERHAKGETTPDEDRQIQYVFMADLAHGN